MISNKDKIQAVFDHIIELLIKEEDIDVVIDALPQIISLGIEIDDIEEVFELKF